MTLTAGTCLGPYEVLSALGAGGMGEVWRARDTRLGREVAVKVLPAGFAADADLRARFEREARLVSSLNHPHICTLHDVGRDGGRDYLVMELVDGESLATRLARGPLPVAQVLQYGAQIAAALAAAHRHGVVHRDLKPGNVMITRLGVKLLDFGLAKAVDASAASDSPSRRVTEQTPLTQEGSLLGTFHYMAPEQLESGDVDARTDIFALGAVLYEMTTGKRAFGGRTTASVIAAILAGEPPALTASQPLTPPALERLVRTCLAKDPEQRWQSAQDVKVELDGIAEGGVGATERPRARGLAWLAAALLLVAVAVASTAFFLRWRSTGEDAVAGPLSLMVAPPDQATFNAVDSPVAVSPDGRQLLVRVNQDGHEMLALRALDSFDFRLLPETEGGWDAFWSPDARSIAFFTDGLLRRVDVSGGGARSLAAIGDSRGGAWSPDGETLLYAPTATSPLFAVSRAGGRPRAVTRLDATQKQLGHWRPCFLPDGEHFLYTARSSDPALSGTFVAALHDGETKRVLDVASTVTYVPPGYLLYVDDDNLYAQPFDSRRRTIHDEAKLVARQVTYSAAYGAAGYSAAANVLAYHPRPAVAASAVVRVDRATGLHTLLEGVLGSNLDLSRDDSRLAAQVPDPHSHGDSIWQYDYKRGTASRVSYDSFPEIGPVWSPDGKSIAFTQGRTDGTWVVRKPASGTGPVQVITRGLEQLGLSGIEIVDWSRDGRFLLAEVFTATNHIDLAVLDLGTANPQPRIVISTPYNDNSGRFSPDGHWIAYESTESGARQVYVQAFPPNGMKWQVSTSGGEAPRWRADGRELFYYSPGRSIMGVDITYPSPEPFSSPRRVVDNASNDYVVSNDGNTFFVAGTHVASALPLRVVLGWRAALRP